MAGKYFYSTPIGPSLSNLSEAIGGLPEREAKIGLLAQQRAASEANARAHDAQALHYGAQTTDLTTRTEGREALAKAVEAQILAGQQQPSVANAMVPNAPVTSAPVQGVGMVPGAAPTPPVPPPGQAIDAGPMPGPGPAPGMTSAMGLDLAPVAPPPAVADAPVYTPPGGSLMDQIAPAVEQFKKLPPKTQQELFAQVMGSSVRAGHEYMKEQPKFNLGIAGGVNAIAPEGAQPYNKARMTDWQTGAGESYQNTGLGAGDVLQQKTAEAAQRDVTANRRIDVESVDRRRGQDLTNARAGAKGAAAKPLTPGELNTVTTAFRKSAGPGQPEPNGEQVRAMQNRFQELYSQGLGKAEAAQQVLDEAWSDVTDTGEGKGWFGSNFMKPDATTKQTFVLPTKRPLDEATAKALASGEIPPQTTTAQGRGPAEKTTPTKPPLSPADSREWDKRIPKAKGGQVDVSALRGQAEQAIAAGKDKKAVAAQFKQATGMPL